MIDGSLVSRIVNNGDGTYVAYWEPVNRDEATIQGSNGYSVTIGDGIVNLYSPGEINVKGVDDYEC